MAAKYTLLVRLRPPGGSCDEVDEHGEAILAEGMCNPSGLCMQICCVYTVLGIVLCFVFLPFCLLLGVFCGCKAASSWRLYLTATGIHYTGVAPLPCCYQKVFIPLSEVQDVCVHKTIVRIYPYGIDKYLPWWRRKICLQKDCLEFLDIENASTFAAAIKEEMAVAV